MAFHLINVCTHVHDNLACNKPKMNAVYYITPKIPSNQYLSENLEHQTLHGFIH